MKPRPKPLLGLLLGLLLGVVAVALLWQLGVAPPDRFILFGVVAVAIAITELLLTQTTRRGKKRFVTAMVVAGIFGGVALTGIPETFMDTGSVSEGCTLTATSSLDEGGPADTTPFDPFDATPSDTIEWQSSTDQVLTDWDSGLGMYIGGFPISLFTAQRDNAEQATSWSGSENVEHYLGELEDQWGVTLRGTFHVYGYIHADEGDCEMSGYIRINAENAFATPLIIALWVTGALLVIIIIALAVSVRRSIRESKAFAAHATATAGGVLAAEEAAPASAEPIGAFTTPEPEVVAPTVVQPAVAEPEVVEPDVAEPAVVEPDVVEPEVVEPDVAEPVGTEPAEPMTPAVEPAEPVRTDPEPPPPTEPKGPPPAP